jgi:hypothetical protein
MTKIFILLLAVVATSGCVLEMKIAPQIPPPSNGLKFPIKVAVVVPASTRQITATEELQNSCIGGTLAPSPEGDVFARTVEGVLRNYFQDVVSLSALPAPADAQIVVEAVMTRIGIKPACGDSPTMNAIAEGSFRALGSDGRELWRSGHTSGRAEGGMDMSNYDTLTPKAMAALATDWANDLAGSALVRGAREPQSAESSESAAPAPAAAGEKPWWAK